MKFEPMIEFNDFNNQKLHLRHLDNDNNANNLNNVYQNIRCCTSRHIYILMSGDYIGVDLYLTHVLIFIIPDTRVDFHKPNWGESENSSKDCGKLEPRTREHRPLRHGQHQTWRQWKDRSENVKILSWLIIHQEIEWTSYCPSFQLSPRVDKLEFLAFLASQLIKQFLHVEFSLSVAIYLDYTQCGTLWHTTCNRCNIVWSSPNTVSVSVVTMVLGRSYVSLHGSRQAVHSLQVWAKWSWCGHGGNKTAVSFFQLASHQFWVWQTLTQISLTGLQCDILPVFMASI